MITAYIVMCKMHMYIKKTFLFGISTFIYIHVQYSILYSVFKIHSQLSHEVNANLIMLRINSKIQTFFLNFSIVQSTLNATTWRILHGESRELPTSAFSSLCMRTVRIFPGLVLALNHRCLCISLRNHWAVRILQPKYEDGKNLSWFSSCNKLQMSLYHCEKSMGRPHSPAHVWGR